MPTLPPSGIPWLCLVAILLSVCLASPAAEVPDGPKSAEVALAEAEQRFVRGVWPLLKSKCFACHGDGPGQPKGELDLRTRSGMLKGGKSGVPALVPRDPARSPLYVAVTRTDKDLGMPPKENDRLTGEEVELIRRWVSDGAPWPDLAARPGSAPTPKAWDHSPVGGVTVRTSGGRSPEWTERQYQPQDLWAYRPVGRPSVPPAVRDGARLHNPIDAFLQQKRQEKDLPGPASSADRRTLLRRATLDLTGLPPTPEEVDAFLQDQAPDAFERVLTRLLSSPHYGEQWAQHWLDVVRYADTSGFANDYERPNAWRYRDYVIRSFNRDKPYDRFLLEQLAGDELEPDNSEMLIPVGFLRLGPWEHTGMSVATVTRQQFLDDVTHHVGVTLLGQGLRCASCHDHKFDPIPTKDYYRVQAVFASTQFADRPVPFLPEENTAGFAEGRAQAERRLQAARDYVANVRKKSEDAIAAYLKARGARRLADLPENDRPKRRFFGLSPLERSLDKIYQKRIDYFEREVLRYQPYAFSVYNGPLNTYTSNKPLNPVPAQRLGTIPVVHILPGGSLETPAESVTPGVLSAVAGIRNGAAPARADTIPQTPAGRRLALARWIASPDNPLTARVIVNRVWQSHFGKGLVATPNNFGKMGKRPTHPELLDWLAGWFVEHGWSLKKLHMLIMTSAAYQQSSLHPDAGRLGQLDPNNDWLAYFPPRRLAAEELCDSLLALTGELNRTLGGPGAFPEINWEVALQPRHIMGSVAPAYQPSPLPRQRHRRTIYAFRYRTLSDPLLEVFNRPGSEVSCERRDESTVTPQVFALFHSAFVHNRALAFALALEETADRLSERIDRAFRVCYGRPPTLEESRLCQEHVTRMTVYHQQHTPIPTPLPTRVHRKMVEEMTGEEFEWEEELDVQEEYQRDVQPWQVGPQTRALADLCLVLLNSNEFLSVR